MDGRYVIMLRTPELAILAVCDKVAQTVGRENHILELLERNGMLLEPALSFVADDVRLELCGFENPFWNAAPISEFTCLQRPKLKIPFTERTAVSFWIDTYCISPALSRLSSLRYFQLLSATILAEIIP